MKSEMHCLALIEGNLHYAKMPKASSCSLGSTESTAISYLASIDKDNIHKRSDILSFFKDKLSFLIPCYIICLVGLFVSLSENLITRLSRATLITVFCFYNILTFFSPLKQIEKGGI